METNLKRTAGVEAPATDRGGNTRRQILEVAAKAFAERGYDGTSLNDLIRDAGVTKGGFYFHFPSKEHLALEVLRDKRERWAGRVMAATMRYPRAIDQLRAIPTALCELYQQDPSATAIGRLCQDLSRDPGLMPQIAPQFTLWYDLTASIIRKAQEEGDLPSDIEAIALARVLVAAFIGVEMVSGMMTGLADLRERVDEYLDVFGRMAAPSASAQSS
jgi:AcrR family transcriptional regulator